MVERWRRVEELSHAALEREPSERRAFLEQVCEGDRELLSDVTSLLARESGAREFLESPAVDVAAREELFKAALEVVTA